jgi:DNA segregation ATPase FtsK/SpoIIIE-like protein
MGRSLDSSRVRRRWDKAIGHCGITKDVPILKAERVAVGYNLRIRVGRGVSFADLAMRREKLAAAMGVRELIFRRDDHNAGTGTVTVVRRSPKVQENPWHAEVGIIEASHSLWDPIPLGSDEHGETAFITLPERGLLIGGMPGTGKSLTLHLVTARAALDPSVHLHLIDYKRVELSRWRRCADHFGCTIQEGIQILSELVRLMHERYALLERRELVKIPSNDPDFPLHYLAIDELMPFTDNGDRALKAAFNGFLQEIAALGRAAGVIPVWATQKPQAAVIPTQIRDLVPYRLAFNCATRQASDTILGSDYAAAGYDAAALGLGHPGLGLLLEETNLPGRVQVFHLEDDYIRALAGRAEAGRRRHLQGVP